MRYWLSKRLPPFSRVLLIESGSRQLLEDLLNGLYDVHPDMNADLVTCYAGLPAKFDASRGKAFRVGDYNGPAGRKRLYGELAANRYNVVGIICSAEPILPKWKWAMVARIPAKTFVLNENGDYLWLDWAHLRTILHFMFFRAGLTGAAAVPTLIRLVFFPVSLTYLLLYAGFVHLRRRIRIL